MRQPYEEFNRREVMIPAVFRALRVKSSSPKSASFNLC